MAQAAQTATAVASWPASEQPECLSHGTARTGRTKVQHTFSATRTAAAVHTHTVPGRTEHAFGGRPTTALFELL